MPRIAYKASENGPKLRRILEDESGTARLYRTVHAGPSGQRSDLCVARVTYTHQMNMELRVSWVDGPFRGETVGWARRSFMETHTTTRTNRYGREVVTRHGRTMWAIYQDNEYEGLEFVGYADSLSLGCDVLVNGRHRATGRHDFARISSGLFVPYTPKDL